MQYLIRRLVADGYNQYYIHESIKKYKKTIRDNKVENKEAIEAKHKVNILI